MKKRRNQAKRGHKKRIEVRLVAQAKGRAVAVNAEAFAAWLRAS